jgi:ATP-binding cassette subfamily B protein
MLALVSERIGADLRTATLRHLLRLSHAYFASQAHRNLMARIGAETDRINVFSPSLLDFAIDVLMIGMTVIIWSRSIPGSRS